MLEIKKITKDYCAGDLKVEALKGIDLSFRKSEFVSILGPSGCGKTTLLNIIGGLDKYTSGDLIINNVSTKQYNDRDWDTYRNHSIGFVFQSYNLIPHQTVLGNVELALTLSGVSKQERRKRAIEALKEVGLGDQLYKKPNAMSGGQMQRVAIARALVNNPDIVLADEPTGALDTETSIQVMEILKKVSKNRLVIMVTHNPELAEKYSTRIIKMLDGNLMSDSNPLNEKEKQELKAEPIKKEKKNKNKKPTMSFWTAFKLSLRNLFTKKGRTILTAFAGSIGIIGIALILSVSQGFTLYINDVQESTLSSYPITLESSTIDLTELMNSFMNKGEGNKEHDNDAIYKDPIIADLVEALSKVEASENDLKAFKQYLQEQMKIEGSDLQIAVSGVQYTYNMNLAIYTKNIDGKIIKSDVNELMQDMIADFFMQISSGSQGETTTTTPSSPFASTMMNSTRLWQELLPGLNENDIINKLIYDQYELVEGSWPNDYDEIILIINEKNELDDLTLFALGLLSQEEIDAIIDAAANGKVLEDDNKKWTYSELLGRKYKTILPCDYYQDYDKDGIYTDMSKMEGIIEKLYEDSAIELKISGIIRPKKDADAQMLQNGIGYTSLLTKEIINRSKQSNVIKAQLSSPTINVLTGQPFESNSGYLSSEQKKTSFMEYVSKMSDLQKKEIFIGIKCLLTEDQLVEKTMQELANYPTREAQQALVIQAMAEQLQMDNESLEKYFSEMTNEQIYGFAYKICEEVAKMKNEAMIRMQLSMQSEQELAKQLDELLLKAGLNDFEIYYDELTDFSELSYEEVLIKLGCLDEEVPSTINIYVSSFENKDIITDAIKKYNNSVEENQKIAYTDYMGLLMSGITTIINAITYVLIAFVAISLIVSSIMIGVITLISVQERTKEIGILRAIGASKKDVSSMFNAETLIIGFTSGLLGILVTYLLCIPINIILKSLTGIANLKAVLPISAAIVLVLISMALTLIAGIIPSRSASKKDPVIALRTE